MIRPRRRRQDEYYNIFSFFLEAKQKDPDECDRTCVCVCDHSLHSPGISISSSLPGEQSHHHLPLLL